MLRATVSLTRKLSRDYQSTGYTVSIDGEIPCAAEQTGEVQRHIDHLFRLAEDALNQQINRDHSDKPAGRNGVSTNGRHAGSNGNQNGSRSHGNSAPSANGNQPTEPASVKQTNYIENLRKRSGMSHAQLDDHVQSVLGRHIAINELTKQEAGKVIESLNTNQPTNGRR